MVRLEDMSKHDIQVMPYSTGCTTPLSNFEAGLNYKDVPDPAVKVSFPLDDDEDKAELVIWTTTPWYALHSCSLAEDS